MKLNLKKCSLPIADDFFLFRMLKTPYPTFHNYGRIKSSNDPHF